MPVLVSPDVSSPVLSVPRRYRRTQRRDAGRPRLDAPAPPCYPRFVAETDRNTVLASLTLFGGTLSLAEAAGKFGVPRGTIGRWAKEHREGKVVPLKVAPALPDATPRARETAKGREVRAAEMAIALGDQAREDLRATVGGLTTHLRAEVARAASGETVDMMQVAAAARALDTLLTRAADVLAFDRNTTATADRDLLADPEAVRAEMARRRRA